MKKNNELEKKLEKELLHKRFATIKEIEKIASKIVGVNVELEDTCNESILDLDYNLMANISFKEDEEDLYLDIYYLKTRCDDLYITEVSCEIVEI